MKISYNDHELPDTPENRKEHGPKFKPLILKKGMKLSAVGDIIDTDEVLHYADEEWHVWKHTKDQYVEDRHFLHVKSVKKVTKKRNGKLTI